MLEGVPALGVHFQRPDLEKSQIRPVRYDREERGGNTRQNRSEERDLANYTAP